MPKYIAVSRDLHGSKRWTRYTSYTFAAANHILPLVGEELPKAVMAFPIAFVQQQSNFIPCAILGLETGKNLFLAPDGRWLTSYVPAALRSYPFQLARTQDGQTVLSIDEDSDLITDSSNGEAFFDASGEPSQAVKQIVEFLHKIEQNRIATASICSALAKHDLIVPWSITIKADTKETPLQGLFHLDEAKLNQLPDEAYLELGKKGALLLAHCQLLSEQHLQALGKLVDAHAQAANKLTQPIAASIEFDDDMIKFTQ